MDYGTIKGLELLGHNAWVAEEKMRLGGWLFRADHGVTRRANSVLPLDSPNLPLPIAIDSAIEFFSCRELIPRFQMTEVSQPSDLDSELEQRGFSIGLQVDVWTARLSLLLAAQSPLETILQTQVTADWIDTYNLSSSHDPSTMNIRLAIMERTRLSKMYAEAVVDGVVAAIGFGVVESPWLGIFNIATHPDMRNRGAATAVNIALGNWAWKLGAEFAYLQVEAKNKPAKDLYTKLGFKHAYRYWYRDLNNAKEKESRSR
ncbi:MAG: GNAT family N-acetyltransferase [Candidatus Thorarchaeota archaeon]